MKIFAGLILLLILSASTCNKESDSCHHNIVIKNNSNEIVIFAMMAYEQNNCSLAKYAEIQPTHESELHLKYCWEDELAAGKFQDIYIVDPLHYNGDEFYPCDSIDIHYNILKHYHLSLEDLKKNDFIVNYP
jgi:hypothetical protein